jgi:hypothetical protein
MSRDVPDYRQLVHPTIEVIKAAVNLFPAVQYFPLRLQLVRLLVEIAEECSTNLPLLDVFLSMLRTQHFLSKKKFQAAKTSIDIETTIKISKEYMASQDLWENIYTEVYRLMVGYLATRAGAFYFPEFAILFYRLANSLRKLTTNVVVRNHLKSFVTLARENAAATVAARKGKLLNFQVPKTKLKLNLIEERDRLQAERNNLIKMKVLAEKNEDEEDNIQDAMDD